MIRLTDIDGVPVLLAPRHGPTRAGLTFRVGQADETLASHGITHLTEHLALYRHGSSSLHFNGATTATATHFVVEGAPDELVRYFAGVCSSLRDLPVERLDTEKNVIRSEAASRARGPLDQLGLWRHGARDYGLPSFPQLGLDRLSSADLAAWSARWFTRQNAVFWMVGDEVPAGLRLDLPDGERMPLPAASSTLPDSPSYFCGPARVIGAEMYAERGTAATVYARLLQRQLFRCLRHEMGVSYVVATQYVQQSATTAQILALVDVVADRANEAVERFVAVLRGIEQDAADADDFAALVATYREQLSQPGAQGDRLPVAAFDLLVNRDPVPVEALIEALGALTPNAIRDIACQARQSSLLMVPPNQILQRAGYEPAPTTSRFAVTGRTFPSRIDRTSQLVIGKDGVSQVNKDSKATVLYRECVAMLAYPDGARCLVGADAIQVQIEPTLHRIDSATIQELDSQLNADIIVVPPARSDLQIPAVTWATRRRRLQWWWRSTRRGVQIRYRTRTFRPRISWPALLAVGFLASAMVMAFTPSGGPLTIFLIAAAVAAARYARRVGRARRRR